MNSGDPESAAFVLRSSEYSGHDMHRFTDPTPVRSTVVILPVFIEGWEIECCGTPPVVGENATWSLTFVGVDDEFARHLPDDVHWDSEAKVLHLAGNEAYWSNPDPKSTDALNGYFLATRHGGIVPGGLHPVAGLVVGLQLSASKYERVDGRWAPGVQPSDLRRIERSPKWFANNMDSTGWVETGVLMELAVTRR